MKNIPLYKYLDEKAITSFIKLSYRYLYKHNDEEIELEIIENNNIYEIEFSYQNNSISVEYEINDYEGIVKVISNPSEYIYQFSNEIKIIIKK